MIQGKLPDAEAVRSFLSEVTTDLQIPPVEVELVDEPPQLVEANRPIKSFAFVRAGQRAICFVNRPAPLTQQIQVLHELAHILTPRVDQPHDAVWARTFVDLVDRFWWVASADLRWELAMRGVVVANEPSAWDEPREWGVGPFQYPPRR